LGRDTARGSGVPAAVAPRPLLLHRCSQSCLSRLSRPPMKQR
jgi:hypothetical protein